MTPAAIAGLVLAAGASSRMGQPKALLDAGDGIPLARRQRDMLAHAGCDPVRVVLGADAHVIAPKLPGCDIVINPLWFHGRFSSLHAGLSAVRGPGGCVVLPVDAAMIDPATVRALVARAAATTAGALRPTHLGRPGHLVWLSAELVDQLLEISPSEDVNMQEWLVGREVRYDGPDEHILNNFNTPEDWQAVRKRLSSDAL